jgi:hypothetical protein
VSLPVSTAGPPPPSQHGPAVLYLDWEDEAVPWLTGKLRKVARDDGPADLAPPWKPGDHWALVGPTGEGKSTLAVNLLALRKYVLALDPKGEDETLAASGYKRMTHMPNAATWHTNRCKDCRDIHKDLYESRPVKLIIGSAARTQEQDVKLQKLMSDGIVYARHSGGWTLYVDEFELLSSQRMFRLGPLVERMLITARRDKSSVVTAFQAAAWVSKHATRQATFVCMFPTRDRTMIKAVAESMGRPWQMLAQVVDELPPYHVVIMPKNHRMPMVITKAPKVGK